MPNGFLDCIVLSAAITDGADLKGKRIAISQLGGQSHAEVRSRSSISVRRPTMSSSVQIGDFQSSPCVRPSGGQR